MTSMTDRWPFGGGPWKPPHHHPHISPTITLHPHKPKHGSNVRLELGNGYAVPTASGGWTTVQRPRRKSATEFQGYDPISQDVPVVLGDYEHDTSIESDMHRLYQMMQERVGDDEQPVVLRISGMPIPFRARLWVITAIARGEEVRRESDGHLVRAEFTISLMEYVSEDVLAKHTSAKKSGSKHGKKHSKIYVTKKGDTLEKIAAKEYGHAKEWHKIADANNLHDGGKKLKPGTRLKIPK